MKFIVTVLCALLAGQVMAADKKVNLQDIPLNDIHDKPTSLKAYEGKVVLLVNVASKCGYTKQYAALEALYEKYKDQGLVVIGVPSNDFAGQEPGTAEEIITFCKSKFGVTFPLMAKIHVIGPEKHPLYEALTGPNSAFPGEVKWNFSKFIIGRDGVLLGRLDSPVKPDSTEMIQAIQVALARS